MQVKDIMGKKIISCAEDEALSQVLSKIEKNNIHQIFVLNKKDLKGVVILNDIVKREFEPHEVKASSIMKPTPTIRSDSSIEEAAELIVNANVRAMPVIDRELVGVVSESDIIKNIKIDFSVDDTSKQCIYVSDEDDLGKAKEIMVHNNVSRVPVAKKGKLIGMVGIMDLAKIMHQAKDLKDTRSWGLKVKGFKEKINVDRTPVTGIMREAVSLRKPATSKKVLDLLKNSEEVYITNGELKIITPKDVLRLLIKPKKTAYFQISGLEDEDAMTVAKMHKIIEESIIPISKVNEIQPLHMFLEHHEKGGKTKYSIKVHLPTQLGVINVTKVWGYNLITAMQEAMNNLDREFWKRYEKQKGKNRAYQRLGRGK